MGHSDRARSAEALSQWVRDARHASLALIADLDNDQLMGPVLSSINPLLWEIAHAAWFQEHWVLQHEGGHKPIRTDGQQYDSIAVPHHARWDVPLPSREEALRYVCEVRDGVLELLDRGPLTDSLVYFVKLSVFHEDMHTEAFTYTRQTLGYRPPDGNLVPDNAQYDEMKETDGRATDDIEMSGGDYQLGATQDAVFVFDNEKWAHAVKVDPFAIAPTCVTQAEFADFVNDGGYQRIELWSVEGWGWRKKNQVERPIYWKQATHGQWFRRHFDQWVPLEPNLPVVHVNWYEADAYCRWAGRRLPSEAEWEFAAAGNTAKSHYPWGDDAPSPARVHMDWQNMGAADVAAHSSGDSDCGCRQMVGNVWEWTATTFDPFPGFVADPYKEYSGPCFGNCKVLRGGCWATRSRLIRNTYRNYYQPDRGDVWAGFRTCAS